MSHLFGNSSHSSQGHFIDFVLITFYQTYLRLCYEMPVSIHLRLIMFELWAEKLFSAMQNYSLCRQDYSSSKFQTG